jgi:SpoVK/Ycf46/Vps4 family AAA+-type ATPase
VARRQIDVLAPERRTNVSAHVFDRLLSVLLVEMDGLVPSSRGGSSVFIIATTLDKDLLDPAILRPGYVEGHKSFSVSLPSCVDITGGLISMWE